MKRKRQHIEESYNHNSNNNDNKKLRFWADENVSLNPKETETDEKKEEFVLTREIADNAVLSDIAGNKWRLGAPIGKGSFGEIFLASNDISRSVDIRSAHFVT